MKYDWRQIHLFFEHHRGSSIWTEKSEVEESLPVGGSDVKLFDRTSIPATLLMQPLTTFDTNSVLPSYQSAYISVYKVSQQNYVKLNSFERNILCCMLYAVI
jgi:hypothetical protein